MTNAPRRSSQSSRSSYDRDRDSVEDWERDWRLNVNSTMKRLSDQAQQTAVIIERLTNRLEVIEQRPTERRAFFSAANQSVGTLIALGALLFAILSTLIQHVSFH